MELHAAVGVLMDFKRMAIWIAQPGLPRVIAAERLRRAGYAFGCCRSDERVNVISLKAKVRDPHGLIHFKNLDKALLGDKCGRDE